MYNNNNDDVCDLLLFYSVHSIFTHGERLCSKKGKYNTFPVIVVASSFSCYTYDLDG